MIQDTTRMGNGYVWYGMDMDYGVWTQDSSDGLFEHLSWDWETTKLT